MVWKKFERFFGSGSHAKAEAAFTPSPIEDAVKWIPAEKNPWRVAVLDVRGVTQTRRSASRDERCAINAQSMMSEDGEAFRGISPSDSRTVAADLSYPVAEGLNEGVLFAPAQMEHKWGIYFLEGALIFVRSWQREVLVVARTRLHGSELHIEEVIGRFRSDERPEITLRTVDFLLRTHALGLVFPAPILDDEAVEADSVGLLCFSAFGNLALYAAPTEIPWQTPEYPLRTDSLLHIAVARGDLKGAGDALAMGVPIDSLAQDGLAALHWSVAREDTAASAWLLHNGASVDVRSLEGATPLMNAVQARATDHLGLLLAHGAAADARDHKGFTALHRAAEMGEVEIARALLAHGADPKVEAQGCTPKSLANMRDHDELAALL